MSNLELFIQKWAFSMDAQYIGRAPMRISRIEKDIWRVTIRRRGHVFTLMFSKSTALRDKHGRPKYPTLFEVFDWLGLEFFALEDPTLYLADEESTQKQKAAFIEAFGDECYKQLTFNTWEGAR